MNNIAGNEDVRHRWNGHHRNRKAVKSFKREAGCCRRWNYTLCSKAENFHGPSKLHLYSQFVETYNEILAKRQQRDLNDSKEEGEQTLLYHDKINKQISILESQYEDLYGKINNLEILEEKYGIKIPESELNQMKMD